MSDLGQRQAFGCVGMIILVTIYLLLSSCQVISRDLDYYIRINDKEFTKILILEAQNLSLAASTDMIGVRLG